MPVSCLPPLPEREWPADLDARAALDMALAVRRVKPKPVQPPVRDSRSREAFPARQLPERHCAEIRRALASIGPALSERVQAVILAAANHYGVTVAQVLDSSRRIGRVTEARRMAARELSGMALSSYEIADVLGLRNHQSVLYLLGRVKRRKAA